MSQQDGIIQMMDGENPVYPRTKGEAVFLDGDITKTVNKELSQLDLKVNLGGGNPVELVASSISGFLINSDGAITTNSSRKLYHYSVTSGDYLRLRATTTTAQPFRFGFVSSLNDIVSGRKIPDVQMTETTSVDVVVQSPITGYLVVYRNTYFSNLLVEVWSPLSQLVNERINSNSLNLDYLGNVLGYAFAKRKLSVGYWYSGHYINSSTGAESTSASYSASNPIHCIGAKYLLITMPVSTTETGVNGIAFYGANRVFISGVVHLVGSEVGIKKALVEIPDGAEVFRIGLPTANTGDFFCYLTDDKVEDEENISSLDSYLDFYSSKINKQIAIVGTGTTGSAAGVTQVGDIYYNTSTGLLRRAVSEAQSDTFYYETVTPDYDALYVSPLKKYKFIDGVFTEVNNSSLGLLGVVMQNSEAISSLKNRHFKICLLGNSYTADCWRYVPFMLLNYGITCEVYFYYRGSGSLNDLNSQWEDYGTTGIAESDGGSHTRFCAHIDTRINKEWIKYPTTEQGGVTINTKCARDIVEIGNTIGGWDIITLQQVSVYTDVDPDNDTNGRYEHLTDIIDYIQEHCSYPFNLAWFQSYTRASHDSATIRADSLDNQEKVFEDYPFNFEIPVAAAVFSARGNATLAALGDSTEHNLWADDDVHLQEGLPCYIGSLVVLQSIFNYFGLGKSVLNDQFRATTENVGSGKIGLDLTAQFPCVGVTEGNCRLAQKAAILAVKDPANISEI